MGFNVACSKKHSPDDFIFSKGFVAQQDQPRTELIYRGGDSEKVFLELVSDGTSQKFVHEMSLGDMFTCGGYEMSINFTDGDVLTFSRNKGSPSDFATTCESKIQSDFPSLETMPVSSAAQRLKSLVEMRDLGLITEAEYETKRAQIISEL